MCIFVLVIKIVWLIECVQNIFMAKTCLCCGFGPWTVIDCDFRISSKFILIQSTLELKS